MGSNDCRKCKYMPYTVCDSHFMNRNHIAVQNNIPGECSNFKQKNIWQRFLFWWRNR